MTSIVRRERRRKRLALWFVLAPAAAGALFWLRSGEVEATVAATSPAVPLRIGALRAADGDILVHWNRDASALRRGARLALHVEDGGRAEDVELPPEIVELGAAAYRPVRDFVRMRLVARDRATGRVTDAAFTAVAYLEFPPLRGEAEAEAAPAPVEVVVVTPPSPFVAPAPAALRPAQPLAEAPALDPAPAASLAATPFPRRMAAPEPPLSAPAPPRRSGTGKVVEPVLLRQVRPAYPPLARQSRIEGVVHLRISVDTQGRVTRAEALDGPAPLRAAAADAVTRWQYRPASLDGEPVSASVRASVTFRLSE